MRKKGKTLAMKRANRDLAELFKSLGDVKRIQILRLLVDHGKLNVLKICEELGGESQSAVSHHLKLLKKTRLIDFDREGKFNFYRISAEGFLYLISLFFPDCQGGPQAFELGDRIITFKVK